jgi:polysaccharide export outer membrane protein
MTMLCAALFALSACANGEPVAIAGSQAHAAFPAPDLRQAPGDYRIGAQDRLNVAVYQEPDLSLQNVQVDTSGNILVPLIGTVKAAGRTSNELGDEIAARLGAKYLVDPQVTVTVNASVAQKVTVEGAVEAPGAYDLQGQTTLLQALAMAKGPTKVADLDEVLIYRVMNGRRMAARFDLEQIRNGRMPDPEILGNDTVVVNSSGFKAAWEDVIDALPGFAIFRPF